MLSYYVKQVPLSKIGFNPKQSGLYCGVIFWGLEKTDVNMSDIMYTI